MKVSDEKRLEDVDPEFARLVGALRRGGPSREALARTLGAVESVASAASHDAGRSSRPARSSPRAAWFGAGALVLAAAVAGYEWTRETNDVGGAPAPSLAAPANEPRPSPEQPTASVRVEDLPPAPPPPPSSEASPVAPPPRSTAAPKAPPSTPSAAAAATIDQAPSADDFRDELALVERIRMQLSRGEADACLRSIDRYEARFASGVFAQEVAVMRIEALASSGQRDEARASGQRFLAEHPRSPYAGRVRSVLEKTK